MVLCREEDEGTSLISRRYFFEAIDKIFLCVFTGLQSSKAFRCELEPSDAHPRGTGHHEETRDHSYLSGHAQ